MVSSPFPGPNLSDGSAGLEEQGVAGKAGADRAIRYLNRAGLDEGSGTSQARCACLHAVVAFSDLS